MVIPAEGFYVVHVSPSLFRPVFLHLLSQSLLLHSTLYMGERMPFLDSVVGRLGYLRSCRRPRQFVQTITDRTRLFV